MAQHFPTAAVNLNENTTYSPHDLHPHDFSDTASNSDASTLIARPTAAYTSSPYVFEKNPTALPGPLEELTPPPSPGHGAKLPSRPQTKRSHKSNASLNLTFAPLLNHAHSIITPRSSANASPTRQERPSTSRSPTNDSTSASVTSTSNSSPNRRSKTFGEFFQIQGSSAPVSFGLVATPSPKKEDFPIDSPFGPAGEGRPVSVASRSSAGNASPTRPGHVRRGSTLSVAATFLGLAAPRASSISPMRKSARSRNRINDEILGLDFENEVFPNESLGGKGEKAFDELLANAEKLFNKMRNAYATKCDAVARIEVERLADKGALEEEHERLEHTKHQLNEMSAKVEERDAEIRDLEDELEDRVRNARTIRMLSPDEDRAPSQSADRGRAIWSAHSEENCEVVGDTGSISDGESVFDQRSRPSSRSTAPTEAGRPTSANARQSQRQSTFWEDAAPFLPPEATMMQENKDLKRRIAELEDTLQSCLGIVDL